MRAGDEFRAQRATGVRARTHPEGDTVVGLARDAAEEIVLDLATLPGVRTVREVLREGEVPVETTGTVVRIRPRGPGVVILRAER